jgi:hypothetical protein
VSHFVPSDGPFTCHDCSEEQKRDSLVMWIVKREPKMGIGRFSRTSVPLCHACGVLYLESQDHPIDRQSAPPRIG